jgi:predicted acetyltransferase
VPLTIRPVTADELRTWLAALGTTFFVWPSDPDASAKLPWLRNHLDRRWGVFDGDRMVGTYRTFPADLTLPGGGAIPVSAVSAVTTRPTHRRQGILTSFIEADIAAGLQRGDVASILYSAEWPIYGRFGYGPATWHARWTLRTRAARFTTAPTGSIEIVEPQTARELLPDIHARAVRAMPGDMTRPEHYWDLDTGLAETPGQPRFKGQIAIHRDETGLADGFVRYTGEEHWEEGIPDNVASIPDLVGTSRAVEVELWRFVAALDLTAEVRAGGRRIDEPLRWALVDGRAAQLIRVQDGLWLRPYDVPRLLGGRTYERDGSVVLEVEDRLGEKRGPAAGRFRLEASDGHATCEPTRDEPDVTLTAAGLGSISLGGSRLADVARGGSVTEHRPGAIAAVDRLFKTADEPFCSTFF